MDKEEHRLWECVTEGGSWVRGGGSKGCKTRDWDGKAVDGGPAGEWGNCKMRGVGWVGERYRTRGRCRGQAQFAKRCWGFSAPPALVFFLLSDPLPPSASENCWVLPLLPLLPLACECELGVPPPLCSGVRFSASYLEGAPWMQWPLTVLSPTGEPKASWISDKGGCSINRHPQALECHAVIKNDVFWRLKWSWKFLMM